MNLFQEHIESLYHGVTHEGALKDVRGKAWEQFRKLGLPEKHYEVWRSVKLRKLYEKTFSLPEAPQISFDEISPHILQGCEEACLVFVNGKFRKELSRTAALGDRLVVASFEEASRTYASFFNHQWARSIKEETDAFALMNAAFSLGGLFLYLPPNCAIVNPIQVLNYMDGTASQVVQPRLHLFAGKGAEAKVLMTGHSSIGGNWINQCTEIFLEEGAHVRLCQANFHQTSDIWHLEALRAQLKRNSTLSTVNITNGSETARCDYKIALLGENAEVDLNGIWMVDQQREAHINILIDHQAPSCRSNQLFKGVLKDSARSTFEGKIFVRREAQKTNAFQLNNNLLLSEGTRADSKPNLEIFADDVKASHGATTGPIDQEQLFYLKTRGYSHSAAQNILVKGFCQDVFGKVFHPGLKSLLEKSLGVPC